MRRSSISNSNGQLAEIRPILLSGVYRSGTTFLTSVVNNIPSIAAASSTVKYLRFCLPHFDNVENPETLDLLLDETAARVWKRWNLRLSKTAVLNQLSGATVTHASVYNAIMQTLLVDDKLGANRWAEKLAAQWRDIPTFLNMFPDGQVIHIFRDPRDVTSSYKKMTYEPWPTFLDAALNCSAAMTEVPKMQSEYGRDRILVLRAEDLASDLVGSLRVICEFLNEPFKEQLADLDTFTDIKGEDWRTNTSFENVEPNYKKASSRWQEHLSKEELWLVEMFTQPRLADFGYKASGQPMSEINFESVAEYLNDPWFSGRVEHYLSTGQAYEGYRTDPYATEMAMVFGNPISA